MNQLALVLVADRVLVLFAAAIRDPRVRRTPCLSS